MNERENATKIILHAIIIIHFNGGRPGPAIPPILWLSKGYVYISAQ